MPRNRGRNAPDPRRYLNAYFKAEELHKEIHKLTKAFQMQGTDQEILNRLSTAQNLLKEIVELMQ